MAIYKPTNEALKRCFLLDDDPTTLFANDDDEVVCRSSRIELTEDELSLFFERLPNLPLSSCDAWEGLFLTYNGVQLSFQLSGAHSLILFRFLWECLWDEFFLEELNQESAEDLRRLWHLFLQSDGERFDVSMIPPSYQHGFLRWLKRQEPGDEFKEAYRAFCASMLEHLYSIEDRKSLEIYAKAYGGGNHLIFCDWKRVEQADLKLDGMGDISATYQLGCLYESSKLGQPDEERARFYFQKASLAGDTKAKDKLSQLDRERRNRAQNP